MSSPSDYWDAPIAISGIRAHGLRGYRGPFYTYDSAQPIWISYAAHCPVCLAKPWEMCAEDCDGYASFDDVYERRGAEPQPQKLETEARSAMNHVALMGKANIAANYHARGIYEEHAPSFNIEVWVTGGDYMLTIESVSDGVSRAYGPFRLVEGWTDIVAQATNAAQDNLEMLKVKIGAFESMADLDVKHQELQAKLNEVRRQLAPLEEGLGELEKIEAMAAEARAALANIDAQAKVKLAAVESEYLARCETLAKAHEALTRSVESARQAKARAQAELEPLAEVLDMATARDRLKAEIREIQAQRRVALGQPAVLSGQDDLEHVVERFRRID